MTTPGLVGLLRQAEQLRQAGRLREAQALCGRVLQQDPARAAAHHTLALIALQAGQTGQAAQSMQRAVEGAPDIALYRRNLCEMLRQLGRLDEAVAQGRQAVDIAPEDAVAHYNLGIALDDRGDLAEARTAYGRAVELDPGHNLAWNNLGSVRNRLGDADAALAAYLRATEIDPGHAEAQNNAAAILIERGDLDQARTRLLSAVAARPGFIEAHQNLSTLIRYTRDDPKYRFLEAQVVAQAGLDAETRLRLLFALGKAREDVGRHDLAFLACHEANRLKRGTFAYDEDLAGRSLRAMLDAVHGRDLPGADQRATADPTPVFIVGMPRSGTTLLEQVLCSHPRVYGAGELRDFSEVVAAHPKTGPMGDCMRWLPTLDDDDFAQIGAAYLERVRGLAPHAARITDKMPANFHYLGMIARALPGAKVIHSMRDPMDSCLSNYTRLFRETMEFAYDLGELGRYYNRYIAAMRHWDDVLPTGTLLHLPYERLVVDLDTQARRIIAHIGLDWDAACLAFHDNPRQVRTASVAQVRQPIYASSVARWRDYGAALDPLRAIVGDDYPHGLV